VFDPVDPAFPGAPGDDVDAAETVARPVRRHLSDRQAEVMERLLNAAAAEAEERPYGQITVRTIAKRAGLAPATAYTYFSGKDHLLAEVLWRCVQASPHLVDLTLDPPERVADTARTMGFATMGAAAVTACTTALLGDGPDVKRVRARIGAEIGRRLAAALGVEADAAMQPVLTVLQVTYTGALLSAGMGHLDFDAVPGLMADATALMAPGAAEAADASGAAGAARRGR
jgi:AcrR family transcriptional regulator